MSDTDKTFTFFEEDLRSKLPANFYILREIQAFRVATRICYSKRHNSKRYKVGFIDKPIANLGI